MQVEVLLVLVIIVRLNSSENGYSDSDRIIFPKDSMRYEKNPCTTSLGKKGVCERAENCPRNRFQLIPDDICSFGRDQAFYCCSDVATDNEPIPVIVETTTENSPILENLTTGERDSNNDSTGSASAASNDSTTLRYDDPEFWQNLYKAFYPYRPAINACVKHRPELLEEVFVGGSRAFEDQHPYMTAIGWTDSIGEVNWNCGGTVISYTFVLTAAHCTTNNGIAPDKIRVGDVDLLAEDQTKKIKPEDFVIRSITKHPDYNSSTFYNDIALIEIEGKFKSRIPACLWTNETIPSSEGLAMGYGTRSYAGPQSNILYQGNLTIVPNEECAIRTQSNELPRGILPSQICAHDPLQLVDTCQGDSGGPMLIYTGKGVNIVPQIIGVTSFGAFCASSIPAVYTRVNSFIEWIEKVALTDYESGKLT